MLNWAYCAAVNCHNTKCAITHLSFFTFPKDKKRSDIHTVAVNVLSQYLLLLFTDFLQTKLTNKIMFVASTANKLS